MSVIFVLLLFITMLVGCYPVSHESNLPQHNAEDVGAAFATEKGVVVQRRVVQIGKNGTSSGGSTGAGAGIGAIGGAALGLAAGSLTNSGAGALTGALVGGITGGILGASVENAQSGSKQPNTAFEYLIELKASGQKITILQHRNVDIAVGQSVAVYRNLKNNSIRLEPILEL